MSAPIIKLNLTHDERRALEEIAVQDMRRPDDALRWLLREELKRRERKRGKQEMHNGAVTNLHGTNGAVAAIAG